ncbi:MAG: hypothetical protein SynsKO_31960 [Synoicihabitans sp.]
MLVLIYQGRRWLILMALAMTSLLPHLHSAEVRFFEIEPGRASTTLKQFAQQARVSIVFDSRNVNGTRTHGVSGMLSPEEALDAMLADTGLVFQHDIESGAFAVTRAELLSEDSSSDNPTNQNPPMNTHSKSPTTKAESAKRNPVRGFLSGLATAMITVSTALAQTTDAVDAENVVEMSPFTVNASEDTGYAATSTLAGTRLRSELRDLGAAISVFTEEFMEDTGAIDAGSLLSYTTNAEVGGDLGNFSGAGDHEDGRYLQPGARTNPQFNQRIRGMGTADLTRDYFLTDLPFDSYNTSRVTVSRGPNSLLFGIGSPGGVINNSTKQALQGRNFGEISLRIDNHGTHRATFDHNRSLIDNRLAIRIAALDQNTEYNQKPAFEDTSRFYGAINAVVFENKNSDILDATRVRLNAEIGDVTALPVEIIPPSIAFHGWFEPVPTSIQQFTGQVPASRVVSPDEGGTWVFQETFNPFEFNSEGQINTNTHPSHFRLLNRVFNDANATVADVGSGDGLQGYQGIMVWRSNLDTYASSGLAGSPGVLAAGITDPNQPLRGRTVEYHTNSPYSEGYAIGFAVPTLQNPDIFDYRNQIYSGDVDRVYRNFDAVNIALEQNFFNNRMGLEFAYDKQYYETLQDFHFSGGSGTSTTGPYDIYISIAEYLPNGQPNPNLGRAYTRVSTPGTNYDERERETFRVTAFGELDFTKKDNFLKFLGRHRFTGLYNDYSRDFFVRANKMVLDSNDFDIGAAVQGEELNAVRRGVYTRVYTSGNNIGLGSIDDVRLNQINIPRPQAGDSYNVLYADHSSPTADRRISTGSVFIRDIVDFESMGRDTIEATALAWQSYLFDEHIVGLVGFRKDDTTSFRRANEDEVGFEPRDDNGIWNPEFTRLSETPSLVQSGDTFTWSVVGRYPERWLGDLPGGMDFQLQYAESENFNPVGLRSNALGQPVDQPTGTTEEFGFLASFADQKFSIRVNWFETALENVGAGGGTDVASAGYGIINKYRDAELQGIQFSEINEAMGLDASFPIQDFQTVYDRSLANVPTVLRDITNPRQSDTNGDGVWDEIEWDRIPNINAFANRVAEGLEIEITANPLPGWRILANISQQETIQSDTAKLMSALIEDYHANLQSSRVGELLNDPDLTVQIRNINELWFSGALADIRGVTALDGTVSNEQREWRYNFVSTYEFQGGPLKGFSIGGAVRVESEAATGYVYKLEDDTGVPIPDVNQPFFDDGVFSADMWMSYEKKFSEKLDWKIQMNIRNLIGEDNDIPVRTNPDGQVAVIRIPNPMVVSITNTFSF